MEANINNYVSLKTEPTRFLQVTSKEFNEYANEICYGLENGYYVKQSEIYAIIEKDKQ